MRKALAENRRFPAQSSFHSAACPLRGDDRDCETDCERMIRLCVSNAQQHHEDCVWH